jgi:hypothetical protein
MKKEIAATHNALRPLALPRLALSIQAFSLAAFVRQTDT